MKYCKQLSLVLCVSLVLSVLFSLPVYAEDNTDLPFDRVIIENKFNIGSGEVSAGYVSNALNPEGTLSTEEMVVGKVSSLPYLKVQVTLCNIDNSVIFKKDTKHKISLEKLQYLAIKGNPNDNSSENANFSDLTAVAYRLQFADGTISEYVELSKDDFSSKKESSSYWYDLFLTTNIDCPKDVTRVFFIFTYQGLGFKSYSSSQDTFTIYSMFNLMKFYHEQTDPKIGLMNTIIEYIKNLISEITQLPYKIGEYIKSLFIPTNDALQSFRSQLGNMMSQKLGAIYQVGDIVSNSWKKISSSDKTNTISLPVVSLNSAGIPFTFGGYDVVIVPEGFSVLVEVLKKIVSILATVMFINGLLKRYDEVMGVE